jgi:Cytochrome oxidase complex assembly protein 1
MSYGSVPAPLPPPVQRKGWFSRNWKWFLPTVILAPLLLLALLIGGILSLVFGMIKSSEPYQHAVSVATQDSRVNAQLGAPVTPGWFMSGSINESGSSGTADIAIPLKGSQRQGTLYVGAQKSAGRWRYQRLEMAIGNVPDRINLMLPPEDR